MKLFGSDEWNDFIKAANPVKTVSYWEYPVQF